MQERLKELAAEIDEVDAAALRDRALPDATRRALTRCADALRAGRVHITTLAVSETGRMCSFLEGARADRVAMVEDARVPVCSAIADELEALASYAAD